jgi:hypothetical protein
MKYEYQMSGSPIAEAAGSMRSAKQIVTSWCRNRGECVCRLRWMAGDGGELYAIGTYGAARGRQVAVIRPVV